MLRPVLLVCAALLSAPAPSVHAAAPAAPAAARSLPTLAVMDLEARKLAGIDLDVLRDALTVELQGSGKVRVLERSQVNTILKEQGFQQSGACSASECAVEMGKLLAVDRIVLGSLGKLGETWSMTLRVVDVQSGEVLSSVRDSRQGTIDVLLRESVPQLSNQLLADLTGAPRSAKPAAPGGNGSLSEALFLVKTKAYREPAGLARLKQASANLTSSEAFQLNEEGSMSRAWAWANVYPFLPIGSVAQGDWAGVGLVYLGWVPGLLAISNDNTGLGGALFLAGYIWQIARPVSYANRNNERLQEGLRLTELPLPAPSLALARGGWQGRLDWAF